VNSHEEKTDHFQLISPSECIYRTQCDVSKSGLWQ